MMDEHVPVCVRERAAGVWITSERLAVSVPRLLGRERATIIAVVSPGVLVPAWKLVEAVVARCKAARASERATTKAKTQNIIIFRI